MAAPQVLGNDHTITAHVEIPAGGAEGVLACSGGEFGGWTLFLKDGRFHYVHNYLKTKEDKLSSLQTLPPVGTDWASTSRLEKNPRRRLTPSGTWSSW